MVQAAPLVSAPQQEPKGQPAERVVRPRAEPRVFRDIPVTVLTDWTRDMAKSAIDQHDLGFFFGTARLSEAMLRDDRIAACLETRILGLLGCDLKIAPPKGLEDDPDAKAAAEELAAIWDDAMPDDVLKALLRWAVMMRFCLAEIVWIGDENRWDFTLRLWHPLFVFYDLSRRVYVVNTQDGPVDVVPGDGKWFLWAPDGYYRGWIQAAVRSLADPWLARTFNFRDWQRYCEMHGLPIRKIKAPSEASEPEKDRFFSDVSNLGSDNTVICPQGVGSDAAGWDLELLEASAGEWEAFEAAKRDCDGRISIRLLGQNLTTEAGSGAGGTYGSAEVHNLVRLDYKRADNKSFCSALRQQIFARWCAYNWGRDDIAPVAAYQIEPPDDRKANADTLATVATAVATLKAQVPDVDVRRTLERFEVPLLAPEDVPPVPIASPGGGGPFGLSREGGHEHVHEHVHHTSRVVTPPGSQRAQDYVEDVASIARDRAAEAMRPNIDRVLAAIGEAASYDELRVRLAQAFHELDPSALAQVTEHALVLSQLAGRHALLDDMRAHDADG